VRYEVLWSRTAEQQLLALVAAAADPDPLAAAAWEQNGQLATAAHDVGESRTPGERVAFAGSLGIRFEFNFRLQTARVLYVWRVD
jgi:hypothetical protein